MIADGHAAAPSSPWPPGAVDTAQPGLLCYSVAKAAVVQLTKTLATEVGPHGIRVNAVAPGWIRTPMTDRHDARGPGSRPRRRWSGMSPLRRVGEPEDIAHAVLHLASRRLGLHDGPDPPPERRRRDALVSAPTAPPDRHLPRPRRAPAVPARPRHTVHRQQAQPPAARRHRPLDQPRRLRAPAPAAAQPTTTTHRAPEPPPSERSAWPPPPGSVRRPTYGPSRPMAAHLRPTHDPLTRTAPTGRDRPTPPPPTARPRRATPEGRTTHGHGHDRPAPDASARHALRRYPFSAWNIQWCFSRSAVSPMRMSWLTGSGSAVASIRSRIRLITAPSASTRVRTASASLIQPSGTAPIAAAARPPSRPARPATHRARRRARPRCRSAAARWPRPRRAGDGRSGSAARRRSSGPASPRGRDPPDRRARPAAPRTTVLRSASDSGLFTTVHRHAPVLTTYDLVARTTTSAPPP